MNFDKEEFIKELAKLISGLQVPRSMGVGFMGTALEPYDKITGMFKLFGWNKLEEIEEQIREALK